MKSSILPIQPYLHDDDICECSVHWPKDSILFMLTTTLNKSKVLTPIFPPFLFVFLAIVHLGVVGMAFAGISILASMLLLWSYFSVSSVPYLPILPRADSILPSSMTFLFFISEKSVSGSPLLLLEHFYASLHFWTNDLFHCHLERGKFDR